MILAIDTSGSISGLALCDGDRMLAEQQWQSGRRHSEQLLSQLDALCRLVEVVPMRIRTVVVARGPGSWSGIRVGISVAKGLALASDATVIGVGTLDALAWPARGTAGTACLPLGRGRFAVATYPATAWTPGSVTATNTDSIPSETPIWCDAEHSTAISTAAPHATVIPCWPRPLTYIHIARWLQTHHADTDQPIEPIYLGDPVQRQP